MFKSRVGYNREIVGWAMFDFANHAYRVDIAKAPGRVPGLIRGSDSLVRR